MFSKHNLKPLQTMSKSNRSWPHHSTTIPEQRHWGQITQTQINFIAQEVEADSKRKKWLKSLQPPCPPARPHVAPDAGHVLDNLIQQAPDELLPEPVEQQEPETHRQTHLGIYVHD